MSDRLISAEKLAEILREQCCDECMTDDCYYCNIYQIKEIIRNMPTVDAEPVRHGHWVDEGKKFLPVYCSRCGFGKVYEDQRNYDYCPNCGAKMDEEEK